MRPMSGNRKDERRAVSFPATVKCGGRTFRDAVTNVSRTGLYLQADRHRFRPGERVEISFSLPLRGKLVPLRLMGRVARVEKDPLHRVRGIGVAFERPPPSAVATVEAYLEERERLLAASTRASGSAEDPRDEDEIPTETGIEDLGDAS